MATSEVQICNLALVHIGANRISTLNDTSVEARECNAIYAILRDEVLESFPWAFARSRAELSQDAEAPAFQYAYSYILPSDCLMPLSIYEGDTTPVPYVVEGRNLLTDSEAVSLRYIKKVTDPALFPPSFIACLSQRMAVDLAMSIAKSSALSLKMYQIYDQMHKKLKTIDARRDVMDSATDTTYIDSRS